MVEFLETVKGKDFSYEKGERYCSMSDLKEEELKDKVLVRQPNSPKKQNWWTTFSKESIGKTFRIVNDNEMSIAEVLEETKLLQL